jgi:hypothetical protein
MMASVIERVHPGEPAGLRQQRSPKCRQVGVRVARGATWLLGRIWWQARDIFVIGSAIPAIPAIPERLSVWKMSYWR